MRILRGFRPQSDDVCKREACLPYKEGSPLTSYRLAIARGGMEAREGQCASESTVGANGIPVNDNFYAAGATRKGRREREDSLTPRPVALM
jgi:hypothetical protein